MIRIVGFSVICILAASELFPLKAQESDEYQTLAREILAELVSIETTEGTGRTVEAAETLARRLVSGGFSEEDIHILGPRPDLGNLVIRYRGDGTGGDPILLTAHLDVVPAESEAWSTDPFELIELDGYLHGRGSVDNKAGISAIVTNFLRWKAEGWVPNRDIIAVFTADEETTFGSMEWLVTERRDLVDAEFALSTDGDLDIARDGVPLIFWVDAAEKEYADYRITATGPGGHSSEPGPENAIYSLARAVARIAEYSFPVTLNDITREYFWQVAQDQPVEVAAQMRAVSADPPDMGAAERLVTMSPLMNAQLRTTCVVIEVAGGTAANVLPQSASATINCRIFPGTDAEEVEATLKHVIDDPSISLEVTYPAFASPPSFLTPAVRGALESVVQGMFPTARIVPDLSTGATESSLLRNAGIPAYNLSGIFIPEGDDRTHGNDERVGIEAFHDAVEFWYRLVMRLASDSP
ncbi:M20/M25/M40 family metallo-hydrolase [Gemmatimonadota bacterium]